jgi:hypothetical protein
VVFVGPHDDIKTAHETFETTAETQAPTGRVSGCDRGPILLSTCFRTLSDFSNFPGDVPSTNSRRRAYAVDGRTHNFGNGRPEPPEPNTPPCSRALR